MNTKTRPVGRALARRERDELLAAFALNIAGDKANLYHATPVDAQWRPIADTGLDLVVRAATSEDAFSAWERHAEDAGAVGKFRVMLTYRPFAIEGVAQPEREVVRHIDLDMIALDDALGDLYDEDVALGLAIPGIL